MLTLMVMTAVLRMVFIYLMCICLLDQMVMLQNIHFSLKYTGAKLDLVRLSERPKTPPVRQVEMLPTYCLKRPCYEEFAYGLSKDNLFLDLYHIRVHIGVQLQYISSTPL